MENAELAKYIDHTLLKADATERDVWKLCQEALEYQFYGVCVNSYHIKTVTKYLEGSIIKPVAVVGFPLGATITAAKAYEAKVAVDHGAQEIDMVINLGALKDHHYQLVYEDIHEVVKAAQDALVKVIIETAYLNNDEKMMACVLAKAAGAKFVKTSTGFANAGAQVEDIRLMKSIVGAEVLVKASGGIRTKSDCLKMIAAGADRIGASASVKIVTEK